MKNIQIRAILEILGRPPEHIVEGLKMLIDKMKQEKGVKVQHFNIHEPKKLKESEELYTTFADIELEVDSIHTIFSLVFSYMPANIEIIYPEKVELTNVDVNHAMNQLAQRLHNYDAITKRVLQERDGVLAKLREVAPNLFKKEEQKAGPLAKKVKEEKKSKKKAKKKKA